MAKWGKGRWQDREVVLAKPRTFMNLSGEAIVRLVKYFQVEPGNMIIIHDDLDLNLGEIRIREKGGDGGHKGVKSIIERLGKREFIRVRMGISRPDKKGDEVDYVLGVFNEHEKKFFKDQVNKAKQAVRTIIFEGTAVAMNHFNRKKANNL